MRTLRLRDVQLVPANRGASLSARQSREAAPARTTPEALRDRGCVTSHRARTRQRHLGGPHGTDKATKDARAHDQGRTADGADPRGARRPALDRAASLAQARDLGAQRGVPAHHLARAHARRGSAHSHSAQASGQEAAVSEPTELERRIAAKVVQQTKQKRVYPERWATCLHAFKRL